MVYWSTKNGLLVYCFLFFSVFLGGVVCLFVWFCFLFLFFGGLSIFVLKKSVSVTNKYKNTNIV